MDIKQLKSLVAQGENYQLEFKMKATHPEKIAREMVAFANTSGGILLIGVEDNKVISGCKYPEEEIFVVTKYIETHCPELQYDLVRIPVSSRREVIVLEIREHERKPVFLRDYPEKGNWQAFVRVEDMSVVASREMEYILKYQKDKRDWVFFYGKREEAIVRYLSEHPSISMLQAQVLLNLPRKPTSKTLVALVRASLVKIIPGEQGDIFALEEKAFEN